MQDDIEIVWKPIVGHEGLYSISNDGRIRNDIRGRILSRVFDSEGYVVVLLYRSGKRKMFKVHRLVMAAFVGMCPERHQVNHIDGNKSNNEITNLEYVSARENVIHALNIGLSKSGENHRFASTTNDKARKIRREFVRYKVTAKMLSSKYCVPVSVIYSILHKKWKYIGGE